MKPIIAVLAVAASISSPAFAAEHRVTIEGMAFSPKTVSVARGDTVVFVNASSAPHTATAADGSFDTGRIDAGDAVRITVPASESIDFVCVYHPSMRGRIETD